jgi:flagellar protein FlaJ
MQTTHRAHQKKENQLNINLTDPRHILIVTMTLTLIMIVIGFVSGNVGVLGIFFMIGVFVNVAPQILIYYQKFRDIKEMEERFPAFLRDLTENIRSGMPFHKAIITSSKNDYGALSTEVRKMAHQLSWGVTLDKVLERFSERIKASKRLYASVKIIRESFLSGGQVVGTLESVAESASNLEEAEKEKKSLLSQYVLLMYAISIIFVVIIAAISKFLIPIFQSGTNTAAGGAISAVVSLENPCNTCVGLECAICENVYNNLYKCMLAPNKQLKSFCELKDVGVLNNISTYYTSLFFMMAIIQSVLSGLIAGQISEGSVKAGIKHSIILGGITVGAFMILIQLGFLGI